MGVLIRVHKCEYLMLTLDVVHRMYVFMYVIPWQNSLGLLQFPPAAQKPAVRVILYLAIGMHKPVHCSTCPKHGLIKGFVSENNLWPKYYVSLIIQTTICSGYN